MVDERARKIIGVSLIQMKNKSLCKKPFRIHLHHHKHIMLEQGCIEPYEILNKVIIYSDFSYR